MIITAYKNKVLGSMIGGAIGDALGYPVEFMSYSQIIHKYGPSGITRYHLNAVMFIVMLFIGVKR